MGANIDMADAGVLRAFGPNHAQLFQKAATIAHKILQRESPGNIPVEQPTQFELRLNMKPLGLLGIKFLCTKATCLPKADATGAVEFTALLHRNSHHSNHLILLGSAKR